MNYRETLTLQAASAAAESTGQVEGGLSPRMKQNVFLPSMGLALAFSFFLLEFMRVRKRMNGQGAF